MLSQTCVYGVFCNNFKCVSANPDKKQELSVSHAQIFLFSLFLHNISRFLSNSEAWAAKNVWQTQGTRWISSWRSRGGAEEEPRRSRGGPAQTLCRSGCVSVTEQSFSGCSCSLLLFETTDHLEDRLLWSSLREVWFQTVAWVSQRCRSVVCTLVHRDVRGCVSSLAHEASVKPQTAERCSHDIRRLFPERTRLCSQKKTKRLQRTSPWTQSFIETH